MQSFVVTGEAKLTGETDVSGSKNVILKALVAACLTDESVTLTNIPLISDVFVMLAIIEQLGGNVSIQGHSVTICLNRIIGHEVSLEQAAQARTSSMFFAPLLARVGEAIIPNPGGCRLGARPIDRTIDGIRSLHADVSYESDDGYFHAKTTGLQGTTYKFDKNTHTGTETLILTAVLAKGTTILKNAAEEPEIDELITLLNQMGAKIQRSDKREITILGVKKLHGTTFMISPDRNEIVTFAIGAILTEGDVLIKGAIKKGIEDFLEKLDEAGGGYEISSQGIRFFWKKPLIATNVTTSIYPGFMTDWQAPWAVLMTKAKGISTIHETIFENKMGYVQDLNKMGAQIYPFKPTIIDPEKIYNFNLSDDNAEFVHAIRIMGPIKLHNAIVTTLDIRAGAAVVLAALVAKGKSTIFGIEKLDRGYENFDERLTALGAQVRRKNRE